jgi:hypothetical protein
MEDICSSIRAGRDRKVNSLKHQLSSLSIENATLQHKLRNSGVALVAPTQTSEGQSKEELNFLYASLQKPQEAVLKLEEEVTSLKSKELTSYQEQLQSSREESSILKVDMSKIHLDLLTLSDEHTQQQRVHSGGFIRC